jgi:hypothetical protein
LKNLILLLIALALLGVAYLAGYWPQHKLVAQSQQQLQAKQTQLVAAQDRLRLYALQNHLSRMIEVVREKNYGSAAKLSSEFFNGVRSEILEARNPQAKSALLDVLATRDSVTSKLAVADPTVIDLLNQAVSRIQPLLDSSPSEPAATAGSAPAESGSPAPAASPAPSSAPPAQSPAKQTDTSAAPSPDSAH